MAVYTFVAHGETHIVYGTARKWYVRWWPFNGADEPISGPHRTRKAAMAYTQREPLNPPSYLGKK